MNQIGCQAMTLGNHEFDHGDELLSRLDDYAQFQLCPPISAIGMWRWLMNWCCLRMSLNLI